MAIVMSDWRSKLESTLADDALEGVLPLGTRRAALDEEDLLPSPPPPLSRDQAADVISCELEEVKRAFKLRREQGKPAEPGAQGTIIHVNPFDESKLAKYEAEMLKRFGDKVFTRASIPSLYVVPPHTPCHRFSPLASCHTTLPAGHARFHSAGVLSRLLQLLARPCTCCKVDCFRRLAGSNSTRSYTSQSRA